MKEYPLHKAFMMIEPGPVVMVTAAGKKYPNVMVNTWTMVLDWTPHLALCTGAWNYTFQAMMKTKECVLAVPTVELARNVVGAGNYSSKDMNKFEKFGFTPVAASQVSAPLIKECYANLECKVDDYLESQSIVVLECVQAWVDEKNKAPKFFHAIGDGRFTVDGETINLRREMSNKIPPGV